MLSEKLADWRFLIQQLSDEQLAVTRRRSDWRLLFGRRMRGRGVEIGALFKPIPVSPDTRVRYVDRRSREALYDEQPELNGQAIIAPDIIDDAESLSSIEDGSEDFVIASHVLEHLPNPIKALRAWCRVVRPGGCIYLVLPDKRHTFDRPRHRTPLEHLVLDYERPSADRDYEHFLDYAIHVQRARTPTDALEEADRLARADFSIHFHVFEPVDIVNLLTWFAQHVHPIDIEAGPVTAFFEPEFHVLFRVRESRR